MAEKLSKFVMIVLLALGAVAFVMGIAGGYYSLMIYLSYIYSFIGIGGMLAAAVVGAMAKPDSVKGSVIGIGAMLVILVISYVLASGEVLSYYPKGTTEMAVKWSDTGLYMFYILSILSVLSIVYAAVSRVMNK